MGASRSITRVAMAPVAAILMLAACAGVLDKPVAHAAPPGHWPPVWQDAPEPPAPDYTVPTFDPPSASHCRRAPGTREVPGGGGQGAGWRGHGRLLADERAAAARREPCRARAGARSMRSPSRPTNAAVLPPAPPRRPPHRWSETPPRRHGRSRRRRHRASARRTNA